MILKIWKNNLLPPLRGTINQKLITMCTFSVSVPNRFLIRTMTYCLSHANKELVKSFKNNNDLSFSIETRNEHSMLILSTYIVDFFKIYDRERIMFLRD